MTSGLLFSRSQKNGSFTFSPCHTALCSTCLAVGGWPGLCAQAAVEAEKSSGNSTSAAGKEQAHEWVPRSSLDLNPREQCNKSMAGRKIRAPCRGGARIVMLSVSGCSVPETPFVLPASSGVIRGMSGERVQTTDERSRFLSRFAVRFRSWLRANPRVRRILIETSPGELLDKITILEIKVERISDPDKLRNVRIELEELRVTRDRCISPSSELSALAAELRVVNETIWNVEDEIRGCEAAHDFGVRFTALARAVYTNNDRRAALSARINEHLGSRIVEEKSYPS